MYIFGPIWVLNIIIATFVAPSMFLLKSLPAVQKLLRHVLSKLKMKPSVEEELEAKIVACNDMMAFVLTSQTAAIAFGV